MRLLDLNRSKLGSILAIIIIFVFSLMPLNDINQAKAYTSWEVGKLSGITNTQKVSVALSNGKFAYVTFTTGNGGHIYVYDSSGLDGDTAFSYGTSTATYDVSVSSYEQYVVVAWVSKTTATNRLVRWEILNTETYALSSVSSGIIMASDGLSDSCKLSNILMYGSYAYVIATSTLLDYVFRINVIGGAVNYYSLGNTLDNEYAYGFYDEDTNYAFYMAISLDSNKPIYFYVDLVTPSNFEFLATHPFTTDMIWDYYYRFLGGGIYLDPITSDIYVYYTWAYSYTETVMCVQHRLHFNSSGIDADNFVDQAKTFDEAFGSRYWTVAPDYVNIGSGWLDSKTEVHFYMVSPDLDLEIWYYEEVFIEVTGEWTNMGGTVDSDETFTQVNINELPPCWWQHREWKDPLSVWAIFEDYVDTDLSAVLYGLMPSQKSYGLTTSHVPAGNLYTSTQYLWTLTLKMNGVVRSGASITIKFDNITLSTKQTNVYGLCDFTMLTTTGGFHRFSFVIYDADEYQDTKTEDTVFYTLEGEGEGQGLIDTTIQGLFTLIPIFLVVMLPAFLLASFLGVFGFVIGLIIGGVVGTVSGILPTAAFLLIVLVVAVFLVLVFRSKSGGGGL